MSPASCNRLYEDDAKIEELHPNPGIIRYLQNIYSAVKNAKALLEVQEEYGSFDAHIGVFVDDKPIQSA